MVAMITSVITNFEISSNALKGVKLKKFIPPFDSTR